MTTIAIPIAEMRDPFHPAERPTDKCVEGRVTILSFDFYLEAHNG
jgi:hypothetical protein